MDKSDFPKLNADNIVAFIGDVFDRRGGEEYLGEPVTMAEHMLQGATIGEKNGKSDEVIAAVLLHDIGHFISEFGTFSMKDTEDRFHENAGAELLTPYFPKVVTECVKNHVSAKRYLCAVKPSYFERLSEASIHSLKLQGGPMSAEEVSKFEKNPFLKEIIQVRYLDESGKVKDMETHEFKHFSQLLQNLVNEFSTDGN